jgi:predicted small secreted protein
MRKLILLAACAATFAVAACNTVAGVGRDVSAAGSAVTKASKDVTR